MLQPEVVAAHVRQVFDGNTPIRIMVVARDLEIDYGTCKTHLYRAAKMGMLKLMTRKGFVPVVGIVKARIACQENHCPHWRVGMFDEGFQFRQSEHLLRAFLAFPLQNFPGRFLEAWAELNRLVDSLAFECLVEHNPHAPDFVCQGNRAACLGDVGP